MLSRNGCLLFLWEANSLKIGHLKYEPFHDSFSQKTARLCVVMILRDHPPILWDFHSLNLGVEEHKQAWVRILSTQTYNLGQIH